MHSFTFQRESFKNNMQRFSSFAISNVFFDVVILSQALRSGLRRVFELCKQNSWGSVALPVIGPGIVLSIPVKDSVNILTHEICEFLSGATGCLDTICIAIMANYAHSEEVSYLYNICIQFISVISILNPILEFFLQMFQTVCGNLSAKMVDNTGKGKRDLFIYIDKLTYSTGKIQ